MWSVMKLMKYKVEMIISDGADEIESGDDYQ